MNVYKKIYISNLVVLSFILFTTIFLGRSVTVIKEAQIVPRKTSVIIDAGHGGIDGGATSLSGLKESALNLEIATRLQDMCNLLGIKTIMIRTDDRSVHTEGESISQIKVSDLKNRVRIVNSNSPAILVSIHQNYFSNSKYRGAQVFYAQTSGSELLAEQMQHSLTKNFYPGSNRMSKMASGIYLMEHVKCPAVLIECGFLSNPQDDALLCDSAHQICISTVIATVLQSYINANALS